MHWNPTVRLADVDSTGNQGNPVILPIGLAYTQAADGFLSMLRSAASGGLDNEQREMPDGGR